MEALASELDALNKELHDLQTHLLDMPRAERKLAKDKALATPPRGGTVPPPTAAPM
jgi:hypothetical protein